MPGREPLLLRFLSGCGLESPPSPQLGGAVSLAVAKRGLAALGAFLRRCSNRIIFRHVLQITARQGIFNDRTPVSCEKSGQSTFVCV